MIPVAARLRSRSIAHTSPATAPEQIRRRRPGILCPRTPNTAPPPSSAATRSRRIPDTFARSRRLLMCLLHGLDLNGAVSQFCTRVRKRSVGVVQEKSGAAFAFGGVRQRVRGQAEDPNAPIGSFGEPGRATRATRRRPLTVLRAGARRMIQFPLLDHSPGPRRPRPPPPRATRSRTPGGGPSSSWAGARAGRRCGQRARTPAMATRRRSAAGMEMGRARAASRAAAVRSSGVIWAALASPPSRAAWEGVILRRVGIAARWHGRLPAVKMRRAMHGACQPGRHRAMRGVCQPHAAVRQAMEFTRDAMRRGGGRTQSTRFPSCGDGLRTSNGVELTRSPRSTRPA